MAKNEAYRKYEELFTEEMELIDKELEMTDELYDEIKQHYDIVKSSRSSGVLRFLSDQSKTLTSLRAHKLSSLKDKITLKKSIVDLDLKERTLSARTETDGNALSEIKEIATLLAQDSLKPHEVISPEEQLSNDISNEDIDKILEKRIKTEFKEDEIDTSVLVSDQEGNLYYYEESTNELLEKEVPDDITVRILDDPLTGELQALTNTGDSLPIIEVEYE